MLGEETAGEHAPLEAQYTTAHSARAVTALEEHFAGHGELRAIEETLAGLETEAAGPG